MSLTMPARPHPAALLAAAAELFLEESRAAGIGFLPAPEVPAGARSGPPARPQADPAARSALDEIAARIAACEACGLRRSCTHTVPGEGSASPRVMFVGEAPGADEDASGRPFVGAAGRLLTRIIEQGMGLPRESVFIANLLKCRPPGNRDPQPAEKAACTPYLEEQIRILQPEVVIALGRHAANHLLGRNAPMSVLRGRLHASGDLPGLPPVLATYHPAYLLRSPAAKAACWQDIQIAMRHLGLPVPARRGG